MDNQKIGFFKSFKLFWQNYFNFQGKSDRPEYWWALLGNTIIILVLQMIATGFFFTIVHRKGFSIELLMAIIFYILAILYVLAIAFPTVSINIRRFRDIGISPWWILLTLVLPAFLMVISGDLNFILTLVSVGLFLIGLIIALFPSKGSKS